jgi:hypothetical protein
MASEPVHAREVKKWPLNCGNTARRQRPVCYKVALLASYPNPNGLVEEVRARLKSLSRPDSGAKRPGGN